MKTISFGTNVLSRFQKAGKGKIKELGFEKAPLQIISKIEIVPSYKKLKLDEKFSFDAVAYDQNGKVMPIQEIWSVSGGGKLDNYKCLGDFTAETVGTGYALTAAFEGVSASATVDVILMSGIRENGELGINVYPNLTKGIVRLEGLPISEKVMISTYNLSGKIVSQFENISSNAIIDISSESPGIYLIKIDGKIHESFKIIKE